MRKYIAGLAALAACCALPAGAFADDFSISAKQLPPSVPAVSPAAVDLPSLSAEYSEYYAALDAYSEMAFNAKPGSPELAEAEMAGYYLRAKVDALAGELTSRRAAPPKAPAASRGRAVPGKVKAELDTVFGFGRASRAAESRGVEIKAGYCRVNFVKERVPFLVQSDSFLKKGEVIITFDDGPGPLTEEVSAAMKQGHAPSVFFILGSKLSAAGKARVKAEASDGNFPGIHGYWHATEDGKPLTAYSTDKILQQFTSVAGTIQSASGVKPVFFRPPYGIITPDALKALSSGLGLVPVGWTIDTLDWSTKDPDVLFEKTVAMIKARGKGIILMHDIHPQSRTAAKRLAAWLGENGYKVVSPERMAAAYRGK